MSVTLLKSALAPFSLLVRIQLISVTLVSLAPALVQAETGVPKLEALGVGLDDACYCNRPEIRVVVWVQATN